MQSIMLTPSCRRTSNLVDTAAVPAAVTACDARGALFNSMNSSDAEPVASELHGIGSEQDPYDTLREFLAAQMISKYEDVLVKCRERMAKTVRGF